MKNILLFFSLACVMQATASSYSDLASVLQMSKFDRVARLRRLYDDEKDRQESACCFGPSQKDKIYLESLADKIAAVEIEYVENCNKLREQYSSKSGQAHLTNLDTESDKK